ncbi:MAG: iron response transcriptional regulator IrrA [Maricaulaceae bacterium]
MSLETLHREKLLTAGLRPTRQRLLLARWLFSGEDKHFTAEDVYKQMCQAQENVSLATIYNTLNAFTESGLLTTVSVDAGRLYYDTNTHLHYHIYDESLKQLSDIKADSVKITGLPTLPKGQRLESVDIIIRTKSEETPA